MLFLPTVAELCVRQHLPKYPVWRWGALIQDQHPECSSASHSGEGERGGDVRKSKITKFLG